jgi:hypothetical protein
MTLCIFKGKKEIEAAGSLGLHREGEPPQVNKICLWSETQTVQAHGIFCGALQSCLHVIGSAAFSPNFSSKCFKLLKKLNIEQNL